MKSALPVSLAVCCILRSMAFEGRAQEDLPGAMPAPAMDSESAAAVEPSPAVQPAPEAAVEPAAAPVVEPAPAPAMEPAPAVPAAPSVEPAPGAPAAPPAPPAESADETFELERGPLAAAPAEAPAESRRPSFWSRLFGRAPAESEPAPAAAVIEPAPAAPAPAESGQLLTQEERVAAQEEVRRQAREMEAIKQLDRAYQAMANGELESAVTLFDQALSQMPVRPHTLETRQKAKDSLAETHYRQALGFYKNAETQKARESISRALEISPGHAGCARLNDRMQKEEEQRAAQAARPVPLRRAPEHLDLFRQIADHIERGRQYYAIGEYEKARREFRAVLVLDEKNEEAAAHLQRLAAKMYNLETEQMDRIQGEMIAQVRDTWTPPVTKEIVGPEPRGSGVQPIEPTQQKLMNKLNTIEIPQLEFRQANIVDVVRYLDQASIACDKDSPPGDKGVNFILNLGKAMEGLAAPAEGMPPVSNVPTVTLSLRNIKLMDAVKYITEVTGLKFRIEESVVVITSTDVVIGDLVTKTYKVQPSIADTIVSSAAGAASEGSRFELGGAAPAVERGDVRQFFVDAGVPFPDGTSIVYKPSLNLLIVKNTRENLESFERILNTLNVVPVQVEIEARFVEVAQDDLEELGVEWLLTDNWEIAEKSGPDAPLLPAARERIQVNKNQMTKGLRNFALSASGMGAEPGGAYAGILSISSLLTNPEVTFILHALEQKSGANLLSAPKVTTRSGANAEIKVVKELIYPTEFEVTEPVIQSEGDIIQQAFVTPQSFETRDTGVILNVTPTVAPDGFSIDLVMFPQVVELSDWVNYGSTVVNPYTGQPELLNMPQPIFHSRNITTSITIWDGQTVVMGGLITEQQSTSEDKIPLLGDIPLLGRLFRSKTSVSRKFNLLIFVTANLVDPAGNKINKELIATAAGTSAPGTP